MHAAESLHWYGRDGSPQYTVKSKDGSLRPATLRDARKLGLVPSVTNIIRCAAAPGLERWKLDQMLHAALTLPRKDGEAEKDYISRIWQDSQETAKKAAERGTAIHAAIQGHFEHVPPSVDMWPHVQGVLHEITTKCGTWAWLPESSFAHPLGFGGKVDLSCPWGVIDFKTKEFDENTELKTWDEHAMQLAAYRYGLGWEQARGAIVYVSVTNPGLCRLLEIPQDELAKGWRMFYSLLQYWKAKNNFDSAFERALAA